MSRSRPLKGGSTNILPRIVWHDQINFQCNSCGGIETIYSKPFPNSLCPRDALGSRRLWFVASSPTSGRPCSVSFYGIYGRMARSAHVVLDRRRVVSIIVITTSRLPYKSLDWSYYVLPLNHTLLMWLRNILS